MITWSSFASYMIDNRKYAARAVWSAARREGVARYRERMQQGYAIEPLTFNDLVARVESTIAPRS